MGVDIVLGIVGLVLLVKAADEFVEGAANVAVHYDMSPVVIGAVILGFGTSAPELLVSGLAAGGGDLDLGVGNVIGSNVANLSLVLGTAALITRMDVTDSTLRREAPLSVIATIGFAAVALGGHVSRWEGLLLAAALVAAIGYLIRVGHVVDEHFVDDTDPVRDGVRVVLGLAGIVIGAQLVVSSATGLADAWGLSGGFVGFSLVALGTSLPELVTTIAAARRRETQLIMGSLLGSNMFNSLAVGGAIGLVGPGEIVESRLATWGLALMLTVTFLTFALSLVKKVVGRVDGVILLVLYAVAMVVLAGGDADEDAAAARPVPEVATQR